ncbi:type IV secretion system protein [Rickettsia endosymbiont of Urophora cardui]|uniref:type IV secretion system protein n=1 Tax=Rickettsia endosymbiont of Urophora cardui TaxID=3066265 RepID=UPI00313BDD54
MKQQLAITIFILISSMPNTSLGLVTYDQKADINSLRQIADGAKRHTQQVRQWKDQAMHWKQTLEHYTTQQNTLKSQLASLTDIRDIGDLEGQIDSLIYEMDGIERHRNMFTEMLSSSEPEISGEANEILNKYQMFDMCQKKGSTRLDNICKEEILNKAGTIETGEKIKKKMKRKMREVQTLSRKASETRDLKESQDIANAISLKQSEINQLEHQWKLSVDEANLREKLIEQKKIKAFNEQQRNAPSPNVIFK